MPAKSKAFQVRWKDGTIRTVQGWSLRGAARVFALEYAVERGDVFRVKERLAGSTWTTFTRTKNGLRMLGTS